MLPFKQVLESEASDSFCPVQTDLSILVGKYSPLRESPSLMRISLWEGFYAKGSLNQSFVGS